MKATWADDDETLLAELTAALHDVAPLIDQVTDYGRGAYTWRTVDQDLLRASLSFDSALAPAGNHRAAQDDNRVLVFNAAPLSVELEVLPDHVVGQIVPPASGRITIENPDGESSVAHADDLGFFVLRDVPSNPIRLRCETPTGRLVTDWVRL